MFILLPSNLHNGHSPHNYLLSICYVADTYRVESEPGMVLVFLVLIV